MEVFVEFYPSESWADALPIWDRGDARRYHALWFNPKSNDLPIQKSALYQNHSSIPYWSFRLLLLAYLTTYTTGVNAQAVPPAPIVPDGSTSTSAQVTPQGAVIVTPTSTVTAPPNLQNGNLFHSFERFNVPPAGVTFSKPDPTFDGTQVRNIVNRVTGNEPSQILGEIRSRGDFPNANVYLLNPNGIVFGQNAKLDVGASFHATTATGMRFDSGQTLTTINPNSSQGQVFPSGQPNQLEFAVTNPAPIVNGGNLEVPAGNNLSLTGGTVVNTGTLKAPEGSINLASVPGNRTVVLGSNQGVLQLSVPAEVLPTNWNGQLSTLPKLAESLTAAVPNADQVVLQADGSLKLIDSTVTPPAPTDIPINQGTMALGGNLDSQHLQLVANGSLNQVPTGGINLPNNLVSPTTGNPILPSIVEFSANGNLHLNGLQNQINGKLNIVERITGSLTTTNYNVIIANTGNIILGAISAQDFTLNNVGQLTLPTALDLSGTVSLSNTANPLLPSDSANGNLRLEADIQGTQIQLNGSQINLGTRGSTFTNTSLNLTARNGNIRFDGLINLERPLNVKAPLGSITFNSAVNGVINPTNNTRSNSTINISNSQTWQALQPFGATVPLRALQTTVSLVNPVSVWLQTQGNLTLGNVSTTDGSSGSGITLISQGQLKTGHLNTSQSQRAGNIILRGTNIQASSLAAVATGQGGDIDLVTSGNLRITDTVITNLPITNVITDSGNPSIITTGFGNGGSVNLRHGGRNDFWVGDARTNGTQGSIVTNNAIFRPLLRLPNGKLTVNFGNITFAPTIEAKDLLLNNRSTILLPSNIQSWQKQLVSLGDANSRLQASNFLRNGLYNDAWNSLESTYIDEFQGFSQRNLQTGKFSLLEVQAKLNHISQQTQSQSALIYPILFPDRIEVMMLLPSGEAIYQVTSVPQNVISRVIQDFRYYLNDPLSDDYLVPAQQLYDWLIRPIENQLAAGEIKTLVFVMDSNLRTIPVAALHDGKKFVIERFAIASIASLRLTDLTPRSRESNVLAMGLSQSRGGFAPLPAVESEVQIISSKIMTGSVFLNENFTLENLQNRRQKGNYNIIHLATHAQFLNNSPEGSFIQLWGQRLRLDQLPGLRFESPKVEILTLSACQTAVGNNLGLAGLAVESGAKSVLASLWSVADVGTAPLMIGFYHHLRNAPSKAVALQQAQLALLNGKVRLTEAFQQNKDLPSRSTAPRSQKVNQQMIVGLPNLNAIPLNQRSAVTNLNHPYFWSPFILVGNWL